MRNILCLLFVLIGFTNFAYAQNVVSIKEVVRDVMDVTIVVVKSTILK